MEKECHAHKALIDLLYLTPGSNRKAYLHELQIERPSTFSVDRLQNMARPFFYFFYNLSAF